MDHQTLRQWLQAKPFTLTMSSGFFGFFAHAGMLSVLESENLLPSRITGSSAGGMFGALWASGQNVADLKHRLFSLKKADFWDPGMGLGLIKGDKIRELLTEFAAVQLMENCRVPVAVSVYDPFSRKTDVLRCGSLPDAAYATCAVPLLFQPIRINGNLYWDGGIKDRPGLAGTQPGERIFYHHLLSHRSWRMQNRAMPKIHEPKNMRSLVIEGLPKLGPNKIHLGEIAFEHARMKTRQALDQ